MDLARFTTISQRRIEAGLREIESRPSAPEEDWYARLLNDMHGAYDIFAEELLPGQCDPDNPRIQTVLMDEIPRLVSDVVIECHWLPYHTIGRPEPDAEFIERFGSYYLQAGRPEQIKDMLHAAASRWRAKLLRRLLRVSNAKGTKQAGKENESVHIEVPQGTRWQDIMIEILDAGLHVKTGTHDEELAFDAAGFGERDQRLETLKMFAAARGHLHAPGLLPGKTPLRKRVSTLRQHLQNIIPIEGDPFEYHRGPREYTCRFQVRFSGPPYLPTPPGVGWGAFQLKETSDGQLAVDVSCKKVVATRQRKGSFDQSDAEVTEEVEVVPYRFSFEALGMRARGQFTREGKVLIELLRGEGKLKRRGDDMAVLKLQKWLQDWTQLSANPLHYLDKTHEWRADFGCSSDHPRRQ